MALTHQVMINNNILFLSYNGILEPVFYSQGLPYIRRLSNRIGRKFILLTYEKKEDLNRYGLHYVKNLRAKLEKESIDWHFLIYHKRPALLAKFFDVTNGFIHAISLIILKRIALVHARGIVSATIALLLRYMFGIKFIFDVRTSLAEAYVSSGLWRTNSPSYRLVKLMEKLVLHAACESFVESQYHYRVLKKDKYLNIEVIPCCVDIERFQYKGYRDSFLLKEFSLEDCFYLVYIGSLGNWNLLDEMLDFFKIINKYGGFNKTKFIFVTFYDHSLIVKTIEQKGIERQKIKILKLDPNRIPDILSFSNLGISFVKPYKRLDSFPIKIGEYLASGLPVILNKGMGDAEEIIRENKVGVVIESFKEEEYRNAVYKLEELLREGKDLNIRCRKIAEEYLSLENGINKYCRIYGRLLK